MGRWAGCSKHAVRRAPGVTAPAIPPETLRTPAARVFKESRRDKTSLSGRLRRLSKRCFQAPAPVRGCRDYCTGPGLAVNHQTANPPPCAATTGPDLPAPAQTAPKRSAGRWGQRPGAPVAGTAVGIMGALCNGLGRSCASRLGLSRRPWCLAASDRPNAGAATPATAPGA